MKSVFSFRFNEKGIILYMEPDIVKWDTRRFWKQLQNLCRGLPFNWRK
jgi:hypothetical protein